jgi:hypothetical protein
MDGANAQYERRLRAIEDRIRYLEDRYRELYDRQRASEKDAREINAGN